MTIEISVPKLSATMEEAMVLRWHKKTGEQVREGEVLVELETDKTALEVEATASGTLVEQTAQEGEQVPVGGTLGVLDDGSSDTPAKTSHPHPTERVGAPSSPLHLEEAGAAIMPGRPQPFTGERIKATPLARRLAREQGLDLSVVVGTGSRGRITSRDIEEAATRPNAATEPAPAAEKRDPAPTAMPPLQGAHYNGGLSRMRQAIAAQVGESRRTIPSFTLARWIDLGMVEGARATFNERLDRNGRLTLTDFVIQALGDVLPAHPRLMSIWQDGAEPRIETVNAVNVGLAVALDDGVVIPVLDDLAGLGLASIAERRRRAMAAARDGRLGAAFSGAATITVSNIGRHGVDRFEAIINPGQSAILAIGRLREQVIAERGSMRIAQGADFTLSVDHRLIDGMVGAAFLGALGDRIERQTWRL